jgi:hypothetical protein
MGMETERSNDKLTTSQPQPKPSELLGWLIEQVIILAEAMGEVMTPARLKIYAGDLADIGREGLAIAFQRARRECRFFPKIAELRDLAGAAAKDERSVEAEAAWKCANDYLHKWGVDLMPLYSGGEQIDAPAIPPRVGYALRRIGGLRGLNQITEESRPFMFKDFCEAYNLAPIADALAPQLSGKFSTAQGEIKQLTGAKMERPQEIERAEAHTKLKPMPIRQPLTDAQRRDRREMLRQQAQSLSSRDTHPQRRR